MLSYDVTDSHFTVTVPKPRGVVHIYMIDGEDSYVAMQPGDRSTLGMTGAHRVDFGQLCWRDMHRKLLFFAEARVLHIGPSLVVFGVE